MEPGHPKPDHDADDGGYGQCWRDGHPTDSPLGTGGTVTLTFPAPYATPPTVVNVSRFVGNRGYFAVPGLVSTTGVELTGRRNKGTLLLSDGPNEAAASGDVVEVLVIGRPA
ncbi:hypothetical protein QEM15_003762 [Pseudomonas putida]|nr:hypothetical protein [Pseudomonas putida]